MSASCGQCAEQKPLAQNLDQWSVDQEKLLVLPRGSAANQHFGACISTSVVSSVVLSAHCQHALILDISSVVPAPVNSDGGPGSHAENRR